MEILHPFALSSCPTWFEPLAAEVSHATAAEAVAQLGVWSEHVKALEVTHRDQNEDFGRYLRELAFYLRHVQDNPVGSLFVACCCSPFLLDDEPYATILAYDIGRQAVTAVSELDRPEVPGIKTAVQATLQAFLKQFPGCATNWLASATSWSFDGAVFDLDGLVSIPLFIMDKPATAELVEQFREMVSGGDRSDSKDRLCAVAKKMSTTHWKRLGPELLTRWFNTATKAKAWSVDQIDQMPTFYEPVRQDKNWFDGAVLGMKNALEQQHPDDEVIEAWTRCVASFSGRGIDTSRALLNIWAGISERRRGNYLIILDKVWKSVDSRDLGLLTALIWHQRPDRWEQRLRSYPLAGLAYEFVDRLDELQNAVRSRLRPHEMAALRSELVETLGRSAAIRRAAAEFLLWCANDEAADQAEQVVLTLLTTAQDKAHLRWLRGHPARVVQVRARATLLLIEGYGEVPTVDSFLSLSRTASLINNPIGNTPQVRTWINDSRVEQTLYGAAARAERRFCGEYPDQWGSEEERLVTWLLSYLEQEFSHAEKVLRAMTLHGLGAPIHIGLRFREIPKFEEGQYSAPTAAHDVDIAFILRVVEQGFITSTRATMVQAKKLERLPSDADWKPSFAINSSQRDRLIDLTESSFYLFLVPTFNREECWVVPARFVRSLMLNSGLSTGLPLASAARACRSLAQWLTYEVIGLWTGDERQEVINRAEGNHSGRKPRFLVEVTISRDNRGVS